MYCLNLSMRPRVRSATFLGPGWSPNDFVNLYMARHISVTSFSISSAFKSWNEPGETDMVTAAEYEVRLKEVINTFPNSGFTNGNSCISATIEDKEHKQTTLGETIERKCTRNNFRTGNIWTDKIFEGTYVAIDECKKSAQDCRPLRTTAVNARNWKTIDDHHSELTNVTSASFCPSHCSSFDSPLSHFSLFSLNNLTVFQSLAYGSFVVNISRSMGKELFCQPSSSSALFSSASSSCASSRLTWSWVRVSTLFFTSSVLITYNISGRGILLYSAVSSLLDSSKHITLHPVADLGTNSTSLGSILATQQLLAMIN